MASLTAVRELIHDRFEVSRCLVIAPLKVAEDTWTREAGKWDHLSELTVAKVLGTASARRAAAESDADVYVINRENVAWLTKEYEGRKWRWDMVVIDELSSFKNPGAARFRALRRVRPFVSRVVGLTGTPSPNGYLDLWAEIFLLDRGERLERTLGRYRELYFTPGRRNGYMVYEWLLKPGADKAILAKLADIVVSMRASDYLSLPGLIEVVERIRLPAAAMARYREMERFQLLELDGGDKTVTAASAAAVIGKLVQLAGGAVYDDDGGWQEIHSEKLVRLKEILEDASSPVLVFYGYRHERQRLIQSLGKLQIGELHGPDDIDSWNSGKVDVLLAHPASVGYGLNLQAGGHVIVWFSLPWSLELYQQANARLYRQGQQETVIVHQLVSEDTIDEQVVAALKKKDTSQAALMAALTERMT